MKVILLSGENYSGVEEVYNGLLQNPGAYRVPVRSIDCEENSPFKINTTKFEFSEKLFKEDIVEVYYVGEEIIGIDKTLFSEKKANLLLLPFGAIENVQLAFPNCETFVIKKNERKRVKEMINADYSIDEVYDVITKERKDRLLYNPSRTVIEIKEDKDVQKAIDIILLKM